MNSKYTNKIVLSGGVHALDKFNNSAQLVIKDDTVVNAINLHNNMDLHFILEKGVFLVLNIFDYAVDLSTKIIVEADSSSKFVINDAFITDVKYDLTVETRLYGDDIEGTLNIRGINEREGTTKILMNGIVAGETHGNILNEYARILNKSEHSNVLIPNLIVNTSEVEANHGVSVGHIDDKELFYMMSKGLSRRNAIKIIEEGFLLSTLTPELKQQVQNILVGR